LLYSLHVLEKKGGVVGIRTALMPPERGEKIIKEKEKQQKM
jgi:hypothetical protein